MKTITNRNAVVAFLRQRQKCNGRNRVAVGNVCWTLTQGSRCTATLGFEPESLWDSRQDIPCVMKIAKKYGLEILPPPGT
jgi:hypothetical protein